MSKNGLHLITPTSVAKTGASSTATISANGSVEFSACETLSLNGVFSADYDNYMIVMRYDSSLADQTNAAFQLRWRVSGADSSTANSYVYQNLAAYGATVAASRTTASEYRISNVTGNLKSGLVLNVYGPFLTQPTAARSASCTTYDNAEINDYAGTHNQSTSYDGFTLIAASGTISGRVAVYGMRK